MDKIVNERGVKTRWTVLPLNSTVQVRPPSLWEAQELAQRKSSLVGIKPALSRNFPHKESS
uniref:Uncharacterized protein n=1 Tax=Ipomoea trifida TaxID=35884 RepID=A0PAB4_IPOTF|nr:hypothetical protein [Ipomoea trifida]